jgi:hypothetical protein
VGQLGQNKRRSLLRLMSDVVGGQTDSGTVKTRRMHWII